MASIPPVVRHLIVCDDVTQAGAPAPNLTVKGLIHAIRLKPGVGFPFRHPGLTVFVQFSGGVGTGLVQVAVVTADDETAVYESDPTPLTHPTDRHQVGGVVFRVLDCVFPRPGLYWVEFRYDGLLVQREPVIVR